MNTTHPLSTRIETLLPRLQKYAVNHATPEIPAEDLIQIASEEILKHCSPTDNDTYMLRLANWRMKNAVKRERSYSFRIETGPLETEIDENEEGFVIADITGTPEEKLIERDMSNKLKNIFNSLKQDQQELVLMLLDGMSHREIARKLNTSQQLISYHVQKIREIFTLASLSPSFA